jgi:hypothetical protein
MTSNNQNENYEKIKELAIKNRNDIEKMLDKDVAALKEKSISSELNKFWEIFENKVDKVKVGKKDDEVLNVYITLSENRHMVITGLDIIEPWFVKITGVNVETGEIDQEILNSRKNDPEIIVELVK